MKYPGRRRGTLSAVALTLCLAGLATTEASAADNDGMEAGRRIYMEGILPSGEPLRAVVSGDVEITGDFVVCGECHRRSGLGASEGQSVAPPVAGDILYEPWQLPTSRPPAPPVLRPAYDRESLARSIREGISSTGEPFSMLMPRYPLGDEDMGYLIDYLESLNTGPDPGVTETDIHFATIVAGDVEPAAKKAMLDVMNTFIEQKNTETRNETRRATSSPWHKDWQFKPYRKWVLHTWELSGPPSTWGAQLEASYREQPVFAVLNGLSRESWQPVHEFCEQARLPCLFPTTDLPVVDREDFYTLYLSRGIAIEAEGIATRLRDEVAAGLRVLQIVEPADPRSERAAAELSRLAGGQLVTAGFGDAALERDDFDVVVAWVDAATASELGSTPAFEAAGTVFLSGSLLAGAEQAIDTGLRQRSRILYSAALPRDRARLLARSTGWFRVKRIHAPEYPEVQANAYFALKLAGGGLAAIRTWFSRDFFIESLEHMIDNATYTSVYPRMSLAPEQRFAAKGVIVAGFDEADRLVALHDWFVPDVR